MILQQIHSENSVAKISSASSEFCGRYYKNSFGPFFWTHYIVKIYNSYCLLLYSTQPQPPDIMRFHYFSLSISWLLLLLSISVSNFYRRHF